MDDVIPPEIGLLHGLQILDLADESGEFCGKLLADLGAEVIKIESPAVCRKQDSAYIYHNQGKRRVFLDIGTESGSDSFSQMLKSADAVIESFPPGYLASIGYTYEKMCEINPRLILASLTPFGQTGPRSSWMATADVVSALGGQTALTGNANSEPVTPYGSQPFYASSLFGAVGVLLAIIERNRTGLGNHIDVSAQEVTAGMLEHVLVRYIHEGVVPRRQGNLSWNRASFIAPCKDGDILIHVSPDQWDTLVEWMAGEGMAGDLTQPKWRSVDYRFQNADHMIDVIKKWTALHTSDELFEIAQLMRMPWAMVQSPLEALCSPQLLERDFFRESGGVKWPGAPYRFA